MRLLLDTHALLWFVWNHANLSTNARSLMFIDAVLYVANTGVPWRDLPGRWSVERRRSFPPGTTARRCE